jgi:hypothetical protein
MPDEKQRLRTPTWTLQVSDSETMRGGELVVQCRQKAMERQQQEGKQRSGKYFADPDE